MNIFFSTTQKQRLIELDAQPDLNKMVFPNKEEREITFNEINKKLINDNKKILFKLRTENKRTKIRKIESILVEILTDAGFVEVITPTMISSGMLGKMGISEQHPLWQQIYWVDKKTCLRPMLAPNLYYLLGRLSKQWPTPIRIFEIGSCFRKESKGAKHLSEFTMLNLVEMGIDKQPNERLIELADVIMKPFKINYNVESEESEVYGNTVDIMVNKLEVASGATGPHKLDSAWEIHDNWAGWGIGLERLALSLEGFNNIRRVGRSLLYLDGARLNI